MVSRVKGKSVPQIFGHPAPGLDRRVFRPRTRRGQPPKRGRPPKTDAARAVHRLRRLGLTLKAIAHSALVQRLLGGRVVTEQRIGEIVKTKPKRDRWDQDRDDVEWWCRGLGGLTTDLKPRDPVFSAFWETKVAPLLFEHPDLRPTVRDPRFRITPNAIKGELTRRFVGRVPSEKAWWAAARDALARSPARLVRDPLPEALAGRDRSRRAWRLTVRTLILRHLWDRTAQSGLPVGRRLRDLAERFALSERQVRRVVLAPRAKGAGAGSYDRRTPSGDGGVNVADVA
jgi:hypothetical protein